uniref:Thioredoxin-like fold domain-containing protein n=1 Tax=Oryza meridionalis TaxID=40149 RepID=A0A0E0DBN9_9ORYZ
MEARHRVMSLLLVLVIGCCAWGCRPGAAQVPVPARTDGFVYGGKAPALGETVVVEAYFDPVCPDSRDAWPELKKAVEHYASRVTVVVHLFPLPYHSNAFISCRSIHAVNKINPSFVYPLLERFFEYQEGYYNQPTYGKTRATVDAEVAKNLVAPVIGEANLAAYKAGFNDSKSDQATRISFKYGCARGVTGTPYFFVNGIPLISDSGSPLEYNKWKSILDPLVGKM